MQSATKIDKDATLNFLVSLKKYLNEGISVQNVKKWTQESGKLANEGAFLDEFVLPIIPKFLGRTLEPCATDIRDVRIREAFLTESSKMRTKGLASKSPASARKYLFSKTWENPQEVIKTWWDENHKKGQTVQSCPDWAFRPPSPHTVVFEGKFFRSGGIEHARRELVNGIYQCFYYRAHPKMPANKTHPAWDFDYACLFAYDVSANSSLLTAWNSLNNTVKNACWESANVFVMVLPE